MSDYLNPFEKVDWDSVPDDPFGVPEGQYLCNVEGVEYRDTKNGKSIVFTYNVIGPEEFEDRKITEWKAIPEEPNTPKGNQQLSFIKQRLMSLNIPADRLTSFESEDVEGLRCVVTVVQNKEYKNVRNVVTVDEDFELDSTPF